jgi:hypothetical protein
LTKCRYSLPPLKFYDRQAEGQPRASHVCSETDKNLGRG